MAARRLFSSFRVVFIRHGESQWNLENRFTGWKDVGLTANGVQEARNAALQLKKNKFEFDVAYTSVLKRAIHTLNVVLEGLEQDYVPVIKSWRLNERHYGGLTGLNKSETAAKHGEEQVTIWRRSYDIPPPPIDSSNKDNPNSDRRYEGLPKHVIPLSESLELNVKRSLPFWEDHIAPSILSGKRVIVAAHGNSLRALVKHLDNMSKEEILKTNIPTAVPLVYELDKNLKPTKKYYLMDEAELKKKMDAVANQGKAKKWVDEKLQKTY